LLIEGVAFSGIRFEERFALGVRQKTLFLPPTFYLQPPTAAGSAPCPRFWIDDYILIKSFKEKEIQKNGAHSYH
jgi:hypothetical protein